MRITPYLSPIEERKQIKNKIASQQNEDTQSANLQMKILNIFNETVWTIKVDEAHHYIKRTIEKIQTNQIRLMTEGPWWVKVRDMMKNVELPKRMEKRQEILSSMKRK